MTTYSATQNVTIAISGASFDLEAEVKVKISFKVSPGRAATLEEPAEEPQAEIVSFVTEVISDPAKIWGSAMMESVTEAIEDSKAWLLAEAAESDVYAADQNADALREERMLEDRT